MRISREMMRLYREIGQSARDITRRAGVAREMKRKHVTLHVLWEVYIAEHAIGIVKAVVAIFSVTRTDACR